LLLKGLFVLIVALLLSLLAGCCRQSELEFEYIDVEDLETLKVIEDFVTAKLVDASAANEDAKVAVL
jgi:hypothetical protein